MRRRRADCLRSRRCSTAVRDRQTLRDWVIRFNAQGPDGLVNKSSPGAPGKLTDEHKAFLTRLVEEGPIPAVDGVVRWRACDLIMRLHEEFGISVSDDTVYRALKDLSFSHVSARPKAYKQDADAMEAFKKTFPPAWRKSGRPRREWPRVRQRAGGFDWRLQARLSAEVGEVM
jgi:transposase